MNRLGYGILAGIAVVAVAFTVLYISDLESFRAEVRLNQTIKDAYEQAYRDGAGNATALIWQTISQCQALPITFNNQTATLVAAECLGSGA